MNDLEKQIQNILAQGGKSSPLEQETYGNEVYAISELVATQVRSALEEVVDQCIRHGFGVYDHKGELQGTGVVYTDIQRIVTAVASRYAAKAEEK